MALTIEDGTGVANADSYATVAELDTFASDRGITSLPATDAEKEVLLRLGFDFVEAHRAQFKGTKYVEGNQYSQFPRCNLYVDGELLETDEIPKEVKLAQMQLAVEAVSRDLFPTGDGRAVIREKLDVLEREFADGASIAPQPVFAKANQWLRPLFGHSGMPHTVRV